MNNSEKGRRISLQALFIFIISLVLTTIAITIINTVSLSGRPENWIKTIAYDEIGLIVALCMIFSLMMEGDREKKNLNFLRMIGITAITLFLDMVTWIYDGTSEFRILLKFGNTLYYMFGLMLSVFFWYYVRAELDLKGKKQKLFGMIAASAVSVFLILMVVNWFNGWCFSVDEYGVYHRTDRFWLTYIPSFFVFVGFAVVIVKYKMSFYDKCILITYELAPICAMIIQALAYGLSIIYPACVIAELLIYGNIYLKRSKIMAEQEAKLTEQNMAIMVSQIQPHFLYNALTTISNLCRKNPEKAEDATVMFSRYLRMNLDSLKKMEPVPFSAELEHIQIYLSLEQMRFGSKLNVDYDIQTKDFKIPALSIQPIVENSVKHGICQKEDPGTVKISTSKKEGFYEIIIEDDGVGFDTTKPIEDDGRSHVGMSNVLERLREMSGAQVSVTSSPGNGCKTVIKVPEVKTEQ